MQKIMIFGAGIYGAKAYNQYGDRVDYFIDNNIEKQGQLYLGKPVISLQQARELCAEYLIIIASLAYANMEKQLKDAGITAYVVYENLHNAFYDTDELIVNPYIQKSSAKSEEEWNNSKSLELLRTAVFDEVERLNTEKPLFNHVEVETINRCNGNCSFCPVNFKVDPREKAIMSRELFEDIVAQLEEINYSGRFTTFSNNEPLLDDRIVEFNQYARKHLPNARMHMFTNGTLLSLDKFKALVEVLDELIIDNYHPELKLIKPCQEIEEYCKEHPELTSKVTIVLRDPNEILTSRGGNAPNRKDVPQYNKDRCIFPFRQMIIRPTGKISLCCNDAIGKYSLGDLTQEKLLDIWNGPRFEMVRKCIYEGRENWGNCKNCDAFYLD